MTHESPDDTDSLEQLQSFFTPADGERIVQEAINDALERLQGIKEAIDRLIPWITGLYYADQQRAYATRELFRLQTDWNRTSAELGNILDLVTDPSFKPII